MQLTKLIGFLLEEEGGSGDKWEQATDMWFYEHPGSGFSDHVLEVMEVNAIPVYEELMESGWWCPGNCDLATQKWKQVFEEAGIPVKVMNGFYSRDHEAGDSHMSSSEHVWLEVDGGLFDPTAGQFAGEISIENYWLDDHERAYENQS